MSMLDNVTRSQVNVLPHSSLNSLGMRLTTQPHAIPSTTHMQVWYKHSN